MLVPPGGAPESAYAGLYEQALEEGLKAVRESKADVLVLIPPGSSRIALAQMAAEGLSVIAYKGPGEGWTKEKEGTVIKYRRGEVIWYEVRPGFAEEAARLVAGGGKWLIIPPDTATANLLYARLRDKKMVEVLYLPEIYEKVAEEMRLPKKLIKATSVGHRVGGREKSGVSLKLLQLGEEAAVGAEKIRALAPGWLGLDDFLAEAAEAVKKTPLQYLADALGEAAASALPVALVVHGLASAAGLAGMVGAAGLVADFARRTGEEAVKEPLRRVAEWLLQRITGRLDARNKFVQSLAGFLKAVLEARQYVEDKNEDENEKFESVVDEVAAQWGLDVETFKTFVDNVYKLATSKIVTEEELVKKLDDIRRELEELKKKMREQELKEYLKIGWLEDFEGGKIYHNVFARSGKLYIRVREERGDSEADKRLGEGRYVEYEVVTAGVFSKWAEALRSRGGFVVLTGPRGVGKSTLAAWHLWQMLKSGEITSVIAAKGLEEPERRQDLLNLLDACDDKYRGVCGLSVVLYDPSSTMFYSELEATKAARKVEEVLAFLYTDVYKTRGVPVIAVVPKDLITQEAKKAFGDVVYEVDVKTEGIKEFIAAILKEYSKPCEIEEGKALEIAGKILKLDEGHALIARLAGEKIRRDGCKVGDVEALLGDAQGNALAFIVRYINDLLQVNGDRIKAYSRLLPIRLAFVPAAGPGEYVMPAGLLEEWMKWEEVYAGEPIAREQELVRTVSRWLAVRHHDLIETALKYIALYAAYPDEREVEEFLAKEPEPLRDALEPWADDGERLQKEDVVVLAEPLPDIAASLFSKRYGAQLVRRVKRICRDGRGGRTRPECWRRMALMAGAALTWQPFKELAKAVEEGVREGKDVFKGLVEAAGQSGLDRLFLEDGELTPFSRALFITSAQPRSPNNVYTAVANRHREIADEAKALWQKWEERGWSPLPEAVYAVGLAALLAKTKEREKELGAEISVEDAEVALRAASHGVQRVLSPYAVSGVIKALSPLGELAPKEWAVILREASQIETAVYEEEIKELIIKELDKLYELDQGEKPQKDWAKAYLAEAYASLGEAEKACSLLDGIRGKALRTVAETSVYNKLATFDMTCNGVDVCKRLGEVAGELGEMAGRLDELKADEELMEYMKRLSPKPEEGLVLLLKETLGLALSGSAKCALDEGDFEKAEELFGQAAEISKSLEDWENYLTDRGLALRAKASASLPDKAEEVLTGFERLWREAQSRLEPTARYLSIAAGILGEYLVALAFNRRYGEAAELLKKHGWLLGKNPISDVATRLALKRLEAEAETPSNAEVLRAVWGYVYPPLLPALAEALGVEWRDDAVEYYCAKFKDDERDLCRKAYQAVRRNIEAIISARAGVPEDLLEEVDARWLVEVLAPISSPAQFILLMWALASGDYITARLYAERGRATFKDEALGRLFDELAEALSSSNQETLRTAVVKLYYYHI